MKTNASKLPVKSVLGQVAQAQGAPFWNMAMDKDGRGHPMVCGGGITYNFKVGDCCMGIAGDRVEPGVCTCNTGDPAVSGAYSNFSCVGNKAVVLSGDAKGAVGTVVGKTVGAGRASNVILHFDDETLHKLSGDDRFRIESCGFGLRLSDYPDVEARSLSPKLLEVMGIEERDGKLFVPVAKVIPPELISSGLGGTAFGGDCDMSTLEGDEYWQEYQDLRFGDIVLIRDIDTTLGRTFQRGAVTIGVVSHGDSIELGYGPGITTLLAAKTDVLQGVLCKDANIANYLWLK